MRWLGRVVIRLGTGIILVGHVSAHEVGGTRFDAPVPVSVVLGSAGLTVVITAAWLAFVGDYREWDRRIGRMDKRIFAVISSIARWSFVLTVGLAVLMGLFGVRTPSENPATLFVWAVWLKGLVFIAAVFGSPWRVLSPWRALYELLVRIEGREIAAVGSYPRWLGDWPAVAGFVVWLGILENLTPASQSPRLTGVLVSVYALLMVVGAVAFGPVWLRRADALSVMYRLVGRVAPVRLTRDNDAIVVTLRSPWQGCTEPVSLASGWLIVALVYTVSFDGFTSTPEYQALVQATLRTIGPFGDITLYLVGLTVFIGVFTLTTAFVTRPHNWNQGVPVYASTVLPIAVGYEIAHNYPFVIGTTGQLVSVVTGSDVFADPLWWLSLGGFWTSQVLLVVGGHILAVAASHGVATARSGTSVEMLRAHGLMTLLMVLYTILSLWLISRPIVN